MLVGGMLVGGILVGGILVGGQLQSLLEDDLCFFCLPGCLGDMSNHPFL